MAYEYMKRPLPKSGVPQKRAEMPQPALEALRSGEKRPAREQLGRRVDLPEAMRAKMENAFGADLSAVKLYESETVAAAGAEAVARGSDIAFAPGLLDFSSFGGQALLGHELSHVLSQARGEVTGGGFLEDHALEARADREGAAAAAGETVAMPKASLSSVTAASAAGPMQASKRAEKKAQKAKARQAEESAEMLAQMEALGFSPEEIEAQKRFQAINRGGERTEENIAKADEMARGVAETNERPETELKTAMKTADALAADRQGGFLAGQMRIGSQRNVIRKAKQYRKALNDQHRWGYRQKREADAAQGITQGIIDKSAKKEAEAKAAESVDLKAADFSGIIKGGVLNQVYEFRQNAENGEQEGFFKPKEEEYDTAARDIMSHWGIKHAASGKAADYDPHLAEREVAYSVLGKLLGSSVALESRSAEVADSDKTGKYYDKTGKETSADTPDAREYRLREQQTGVLMEKAKGSYWHDYNWKFLGIDKKNAEVFKKSREQPNTHNLGERIADAGAHLEEKHTNRDINPAKLKKLRSGKPASYSVDKRYSSEEELDFADPDFQRQMNEMYLLDMLAGYQDRHAGNFMVNREDGKTSVKALDNDLTFGTNTKDFGKRVSHNGGTPEQMQIDKKMAEKIRGMKKETLETALGHLLKQEEIDALWERFGKMNALIDTMEKNHLLVNEWNEDTAAKEFSLASGFSNGTAAGQGNSYYQKLLLMLNAHQQNFNFLPGFL